MDHKPSFSVNEAGTLFHDFASGDAGDTMDFFQRASQLPLKDACRKFIELAGERTTSSPHLKLYQAPPAEIKPKPSLPEFWVGTADEIRRLAILRNIGREGLMAASERGLLRFAKLRDTTAWIVTDASRLNAQARRLDGQLWEHIGAKAWTLPTSLASWPIGIMEAQTSRIIALCEGAPDFLAAHYLMLWEGVQCSPVAMLGASQRIHVDALPLFAGKRVRIFGHDDVAGRGAVLRWAAQLATVGAKVDAFSFAGLQQEDGKPVKDLNDSLLMDVKSFTRVEKILP